MAEKQQTEPANDTGLKQLRGWAKVGSVRSQFLLGLALASGEEGEPDPQAAAKWYRKAAKQGFAPAANNLGALYLSGALGEPNPVEAAKWFTEAAEAGEALARFNLARHLMTSRDEKAAIGWMQKAAEQEMPAAQNNLGVWIAEGRGANADETPDIQELHLPIYHICLVLPVPP